MGACDDGGKKRESGKDRGEGGRESRSIKSDKKDDDGNDDDDDDDDDNDDDDE
jgi:hypothetical protein